VPQLSKLGSLFPFCYLQHRLRCAEYLPIFIQLSLVFVLPFFLLKRLHMIPRAQLWGLISIFGLGGISIAMSVARIIALGISATTTSVAVWTALECSTGIMVACLPALRALLRRPGERSHINSTSRRESLRFPARTRECANESHESKNKTIDDGEQFPLVPVPAGPNEIIKSVDFEIESERASQISRPMTRGRSVNQRLEAWDKPV
jgi:hypothetical protein